MLKERAPHKFMFVQILLRKYLYIKYIGIESLISTQINNIRKTKLKDKKNISGDNFFGV